MNYFLKQLYDNLNLFENNPYMFYYHNVDGYDIFKVSYALRGMNSMFTAYDLYDLFNDYEKISKERLDKNNGEKEKRFVYYFTKNNGDDGFFYDYLNGYAVYFHGQYDGDNISSKEIPEKIDMDGVKAITKIDKSAKSNIIHHFDGCPDHIEDNSIIHKYTNFEFIDCDNFKYIGENVTSNASINIKNCPNFTYIGKNFLNNGFIMIQNCINFSKIKRGMNAYILYVTDCKNFDLDSLSHHSKIEDLRIYDSGFSNDILNMYEQNSLEEIDDFLSKNFPNVNITNIHFGYNNLYNLTPEKREELVNHFKKND